MAGMFFETDDIACLIMIIATVVLALLTIFIALTSESLSKQKYDNMFYYKQKLNEAQAVYNEAQQAYMEDN